MPRWVADWGPLLLLVGVWLLFMWYFTTRRSNPALAELRRHNDVLEKILANHEARLQKLEEKKGE